MVGRAHRPLVVLDHDHRVPEVTQPLERGDQLLVVPLVQPDRRLVEDVQDSHERGADLRRQADPLSLSAGEGGGATIHRQIPDADVLQEPQPLLDLPEHEPGDPAVVLGQGERLKPNEGAPGATGA